MSEFTRRAFLRIAVAGLSTKFITGCGGSSNSSSGQEPPPPSQSPDPQLLLFPNTNDPRIVRGTTEDGDTFTILGEKDALGRIGTANTVVFGDDDAGVSWVTYDPELQSYFSSGDGIETKLTGLFTQDLVFDFRIKDSQLSLNLPAEPASPSGLSSLYSQRPKRTDFNAPIYLQMTPTTCCSLSLPLPEKQGYSDIAGMASLGQASAVPIVRVFVAGCPGENQVVRVTVRDEAGRVLENLEATPDPGGWFNVVIPDSLTGNQELVEAVEKLLDFISSEFGIVGVDLWSLARGLRGYTIDTLVDALVAQFLKQGPNEKIYNDLGDFFVDGLPGVPGFDFDSSEIRGALRKFFGTALRRLYQTYNIADRLRRAFELQFLIDQFGNAYFDQEFAGLQLQPVVWASDGRRFAGTGSGVLPPQGPYPDLTVNIPGDGEISSLELQPRSPVEGQDYLATATITCLNAGDRVTISVAGSDGYSDTKTEVVAVDGGVDVRLLVPGADSGVRDTVTVSVRRSGDTVSSLTASLIFS